MSNNEKDIEYIESSDLRNQPNFDNSSRSSTTTIEEKDKKDDRYGHRDTFGESEANQVSIKGKLYHIPIYYM